MYKFKNLLGSYRKSINPPYVKNDYLSIAATFLVLLVAFIVVSSIPNGFKGQYTKESSASNGVRGNTGDLTADIVIGKPDFNEINPYTTVGNKLFLPHGVIVDRSTTPNKMYVYDAGHNRILGMDLGKCLSDPTHCAADIVIGQPDMSTSTCNGDSAFQNYPIRATASASTLCGLQESQLSITEGGSGASMSVDSQGNLYVFDAFNNRVLKYNSPFTTDTVADDVWGQANFSDNKCNKGNTLPNASTLCYGWGNSNNWTAGVDIDSQGNLWVVDNQNNRVLRFSPGSKTANLVLGQADFTSNGTGNALNQLNAPAAVRVNPQGWVYVADQGNHRVIVYKGNLTNGSTGTLFGSGFEGPAGVDFDPTQAGVWVSDYQKTDIELWDENTNTLIKTLAQTHNGNVAGDSTGSVGIDSTGNVFTATGIGDYNDDVLMFAKNGSLTTPSQILFDKANSNYVDGKSLASVKGIAIADGQLIIGDEGRILFWNDPASLVSGKAADGVIVAPNFNTLKGGCCVTLKADKNHHLFVSFSQNGDSPDMIQVFQLPLVTGVQPTNTIKFPLNVLGGGVLPFPGQYQSFEGIAPSDAGDFLWVSHPSSNRVIRIRNPLTNPVVDVILGQKDLVGTACNMGATVAPDSLCYPGGVSLDKLGILYVSDHSLEIRGNMRLLEFNQNLFPTNNASVIYTKSASKIFPNVATWQPAFDSQNHMVVGYNPYWTANPQGGWFPGVYNDPLTAATPNATVSDYFSMAFTASFDDNDNLYIGDLDRARVLIYKQPFLNSPTSTPALTPTNTPIPTAIKTPTPTVIPTSTPKPTITPKPTATPRPTATPKPTVTPKPTSTPTPTPVPPTPTPTVSQSGFIGQYFDNQTLSGTPMLTRNDATINFNWGNGSPASLIPADHFSVRWTKTENFSTQGSKTFTVTADDGVRLYIDGVIRLDKWINESTTTYHVSVNLTRGNHVIKMEYFENTGSAVAKLSY